MPLREGGVFLLTAALDIFEQDGDLAIEKLAPLAARMRPRTLDEFIGQSGIIGQDKLLRRSIEADCLGSIILYGPPGCGKTSLAEVIAGVTERHFERTSGVLANVATLRTMIEQAAFRRRTQQLETILFIDEIHRFNKSQQDVLLPHVESGIITLVGATTHNPQVFINTPLTSRSLVFELATLTEDDIADILRRALQDERGLADWRVEADPAAIAYLANLCEGDARRALNALERAVLSTPPDAEGVVQLALQVAEESIQKRIVNYDRDEDGHYDTISAFIKSVRGSDPDAAVYWLAKMVFAGEDPRFIARRLMILASEDIGNADPRGLTVAVAACRAVEFVGMPEARIILSQATTYLASAPKSNASYLAIDKALDDIKHGRVLKVPERLKNVKVKTAAKADAVGVGDYIYPHDFVGHHVKQDYVPTTTRYYEPTSQGYEDTIRQRLERWRA